MRLPTIRNTNALTASCYLSMFFLGLSGSLIGGAARNIGLTPYEIGLLISTRSLGFMLGVAASGALADVLEKPKILLAGSLLLAVGLFSFYLSPLLWVNLVLMLLVGAGVGTYEGVTDAMLFEIHPTRASFHVNVNHFFVTFGSTMITAYLIFLQMNWRIATVQASLVVLLLALFFGLARLGNGRRQAESYLRRLRIVQRERVVLFLFVATALAVGVEAGSIGILTTYLMELRGFDQVTSKIGLTVFLVGIASGRLSVGFFMPRERIVSTLFFLLGASMVLLTLLYSWNLGAFSYVAIFLAGLSISAILPLIITLAGLLYQELAGTVLGAIKVAMPLGGIFIPFLMSLVAQQASLQVSLLLFPAVTLISFTILFLGIRHVDTRLPVATAEAAD